MLQKIKTMLKWASIPALIALALFSDLAGPYRSLLNLGICLSAVLFMQRATWLKEYAWGAVSVVVCVVFSPLLLLTKIFLLMFLTCIAALLALRAAFRPQTVAAL